MISTKQWFKNCDKAMTSFIIITICIFSFMGVKIYKFSTTPSAFETCIIFGCKNYELVERVEMAKIVCPKCKSDNIHMDEEAYLLMHPLLDEVDFMTTCTDCKAEFMFTMNIKENKDYNTVLNK